MKRIGCALVLVALLGACGSSARAVRPAKPVVKPALHRGKLLGWYPMAYFATNRDDVSIQLLMKAPAGVTVGRSVSIDIEPLPDGKPVWMGITPARITAHRRGGEGRMQIATEGCPAKGACDRRPLYALTGMPIPSAPAGGVVTRKGIELQVDTSSVRPGRYDFTLPIRYPSARSLPNDLDVRDTLRIRIDVDATAPPPSTCTPADLRRPTAVIPAAHRLTDTIALQDGGTRLDPPPAGFQPGVPASRAREMLAGGFSGSGGEATLVLATLSQMLPASQGPDGVLRPDIHNVVAWVLYTQRVAVSANSVSRPPQGPGPTEATTPPDACFFSDGLGAIDAKSGKPLGNGGGSGPPDLIQF